MRRVLGIDTAQRQGSIALAEDGETSAWETLAPGEHSSGLSRAAERILAKRNARLSDLTGIAVSGGPGSFTGLRIGLAWAKGVCLGLSAKLTLVSEHEANAYRHRRSARMIATVLPGERGEAQAALWAGGTECVWGPERVLERDLVGTLREAAAAAVVTVAAPGLDPELVASLERSGFLVASADSLPPTAAAVAELGDRNLLAGREDSLAEASPSYGRAPNARKPSP